MILLDTCTLLWLDSNRKALSTKARAQLDAHADALAVSPISFHEIGIKQARGGLDLPLPLADWVEGRIQRYGFIVIPVTTEIAVRAATLPPLLSASQRSKCLSVERGGAFS